MTAAAITSIETRDVPRPERGFDKFFSTGQLIDHEQVGKLCGAGYLLVKKNLLREEIG